MVYPAGAGRQARLVARGFAPRRAAAAALLGIAAAGPARIYLVEDYAGMRRRAGAGAPDWAVAIARADGVIVFRLDRVDRTPSTALGLVLTHEVVHNVLGGLPLPRWFEEGLCEYQAGVAVLDTDYSIERLAAAGNLPALAETGRAFSRSRAEAAAAYKASHSAVTYFMRRYGAVDLRRLLSGVRSGRPFEACFEEATGTSLAKFEEQWGASVTPDLPFLLFVLLENIELTLLFLGGLLVIAGYIRWRLRRERAMQSLGE